MQSYSFKATPKETDYVRICRENHQARFLVVRTEGAPALTFVRCYSPEHYELRKGGSRPSGKIDVPPVKDVPDNDRSRTYIIFEGDRSKELAPKITTTVEAY